MELNQKALDVVTHNFGARYAGIIECYVRACNMESEPIPFDPALAKPTAIPSLDDLDMRDYFAAKAMQGTLASLVEGEDWNTERGAEWCYKVADAMIKAREGS